MAGYRPAAGRLLDPDCRVGADRGSLVICLNPSCQSVSGTSDDTVPTMSTALLTELVVGRLPSGERLRVEYLPAIGETCRGGLRCDGGGVGSARSTWTANYVPISNWRRGSDKRAACLRT